MQSCQCSQNLSTAAFKVGDLQCVELVLIYHWYISSLETGWESVKPFFLRSSHLGSALSALAINAGNPEHVQRICHGCAPCGKRFELHVWRDEKLESGNTTGFDFYARSSRG
jgi:hypothetical protein